MGGKELGALETSGENRCRILSRDAIKYIAVFTMLLNHVALIFLTPGSITYGIFVSIGYFAAITMIYFLVEGYRYTHSKKAYFKRLLAFGIVSQIPYSVAFAQEKIIDFTTFNMLLTLCLCFCLMCGMENIEGTAAKAAFALLLIFISTMFDWPLMAPVFTLLFVWADHSHKKIKVAFAGAIFIFMVFNIWEGTHWLSAERNLFYAILGMGGMGMSELCIVHLYNGKRMEKAKNFSKWFFYIFYPAHLLILGMIRLVSADI